MGLYIKGMELPKEGDWITLRVFPNGQCFLYDWCGNDFDFMEHLTAVPVPPHGRLIDADALISDGFYAAVCYTGKMPYEYTAMRIDDAPTIIPAEEV